MGILDLFRKDEVIGAKVLVCSLDTRFDEFLNGDAGVYRHHYRATTTNVFATIQDLIKALGQKYDVVHLLCDVSSRGEITDGSGNNITGTQLIQRCCEENVKLLWIASDNQPQGYVTGFGARGKRLNLVMTIDRNGPNFSDFLQKLLFRMFCGDSMPVAWNDLASQIPGSPHPDAPGLIFFAGRGAVRLR
jgi:hypothetical protein